MGRGKRAHALPGKSDGKGGGVAKSCLPPRQSVQMIGTLMGRRRGDSDASPALFLMDGVEGEIGARSGLKPA